MEPEVSEYGMGVFILSDTRVKIVGAGIVAGLAESDDVGEGGHGDTAEEPEQSAGWLGGEMGRVEPSAGGRTVEEDKGHKAPETSARKVVQAVPVRSKGAHVSALLVLVELFKMISLGYM